MSIPKGLGFYSTCFLHLQIVQMLNDRSRGEGIDNGLALVLAEIQSPVLVIDRGRYSTRGPLQNQDWFLVGHPRKENRSILMKTSAEICRNNRCLKRQRPPRRAAPNRTEKLRPIVSKPSCPVQLCCCQQSFAALSDQP